MCTIAESEKKKNIYIYILFGWLIKIIHLPFFFFMPLSVSLSLISQAHSLNSDHRPAKLAGDWSA